MSPPEKCGTRESVWLYQCVLAPYSDLMPSVHQNDGTVGGKQVGVMQMSEILVDSRLYKRYVLASEDSPPGYVQPTPRKLYIALIAACLYTILSVSSIWQIGTKNSFQDFNLSTFLINLPPNTHLGGLLKGIWPVTMNLILLVPKEKCHFFGIWFPQISKWLQILTT